MDLKGPGKWSPWPWVTWMASTRSCSRLVRSASPMAFNTHPRANPTNIAAAPQATSVAVVTSTAMSLPVVVIPVFADRDVGAGEARKRPERR